MGRDVTQSRGEEVLRELEKDDICSEVRRTVLTDAGKRVEGTAKS